MVCSTSTGTAEWGQSSCSSSSSVKGTKVMRATSFVTSMEVKKGNSTSVTPSRRGPPQRRSNAAASHRNAPQDWKPATTAIRHSSRHSTRKSI